MSLVVIMLSGESCQPCARMLPIFEQVCAETGVENKVIKVTAGSEEAAKYGVRTVPTFVIEQDGRIASKLLGMQAKGNLINLIKQFQD